MKKALKFFLVVMMMFISIKNINAQNMNISLYYIPYEGSTIYNTNITSITINEIIASYNNESNQFEITVPSTLESVGSSNINVVLEDELARLSVIEEIPLELGTNEISLTVTAQDGTIDIYKLIITKSIDNLAIFSEVHEIVDEYVVDVLDNETWETLSTQFQQEATFLELWNAANTEKFDDTKIAGTGMIIKLVIGSIEVDSKKIVVRGDTTGDGVIANGDVVKLFRTVKGTMTVEGAYRIASDTTGDDNLANGDVVKLFRYVKGSITTLH